MNALLQSTKSALRSLRANALRSLLTSLGIIIGVGAVIMMISISEGNTASINQHLSTLNPLQLTVRPGSATGTGNVRQGAGTQQSLTQSDANTLARVSSVTAVSPIINIGSQIIAGNQNWQTTVQGVYPSYQQIASWQLQEGNFITSDNQRGGQAVAVLGQTVVDNLFPVGVDPLGQQIRINNVPFTVSGVLAQKGVTGAGTNADDVVFVPLSTVQQRLSGNRQYVNSIVLTANSNANIDNVQAQVQQVLMHLHHISNPALNDFTIQNEAQVLATVQSSNQSLTILLISVAAISLVIGGIGIMNIMLVSVTERTREIGIRIAIGARPHDVMTQFLIEAFVLSALGGLVGMILGPVGAILMAKANNFPFVLDPLSILLAFGVSACIGVVFGFYPARRAAQLDPIVALRME